MWGGSVERNCEPMNKNRIEGAAEQGERAKDRKALVIKAKWRRSGGCAAKECDPYLGRSRLMPERATVLNPDFPLARIERVDWREFGGQVE